MPAFVNPHKYPQGLLASAGNDLTIKVWHVSDRQELELACMVRLLLIIKRSTLANSSIRMKALMSSICAIAILSRMHLLLGYLCTLWLTMLMKVHGHRRELSLHGLRRPFDQDLGHVRESADQVLVLVCSAAKVNRLQSAGRVEQWTLRLDSQDAHHGN